MPHSQREDFESRIREYWSWIGVALFLLLTVDLLTTVFAVSKYGLAVEQNPLMRWLLAQGFGAVVVAHLAALVLAGVFSFGVIETVRRIPEPQRGRYAVAVEVWIGSLVSVGLFLFANNLSVIVLQQSLL